MSLITRIIAYIGIAFILLIVLFSAWLAYTNNELDWYGLFICVIFIALLVFFAHTLQKDAQQAGFPFYMTSK